MSEVTQLVSGRAAPSTALSHTFLVLGWRGRLTVTMGRCFVGGFVVVSSLFSRSVVSDSLRHRSVGSLACCSPWGCKELDPTEATEQQDFLIAAHHHRRFSSVQLSSVAQLCPALCDPMNHSTPGLPVHHHLPEFTQTHVHQVRDAIQPSHPLSSPSPPAPNPSQHHSLFQ